LSVSSRLKVIKRLNGEDPEQMYSKHLSV